MCCCLYDHRPAHLRRVHEALVALSEPDQVRLGVLVCTARGPHRLTYRQTEYVSHRVRLVLANDAREGGLSDLLASLVDALLEASLPTSDEPASTSLAIDWTDVESFSTRRTRDGAYPDPEAAWGHRKGGGPGEKDELFFGYYLSLATMVVNEGGEAVPELVRRMTLGSCALDPVPALVTVLERLAGSGVGLGDVVADSGYAHRQAEHFALPLRRCGARLVIDLHPHDRGQKGTFAGAILANGQLYCPGTPKALFAVGPLGRRASAVEIAAHDEATAELSRYKLGRITADDADGYHRVMCPAVAGKLRCALRPDSLSLSYTRPSVLGAPEHPPLCCVQQSVTIPPSVNAKTDQKHDYPSRAHRESYARRSGAERSNSRLKDPATIDIARGWCRQMGLVPLAVFLACAIVVRNLAVLDAFTARQQDEQRRARKGLAPKRRRRRRRMAITDLLGTAHAPP